VLFFKNNFADIKRSITFAARFEKPRERRGVEKEWKIFDVLKRRYKR
jgi:hypothetical protein